MSDSESVLKLSRFFAGILLTGAVMAIIRSIQTGVDPLTIILDTGKDALRATIRGYRNNNPGNIKISANAWKGKKPLSENTDGVFEQFYKPEDGIRALGILARNYPRKYGDNTLARIITRYAPSNENDTTAYINAAAKFSGLDPFKVYDFENDPNARLALVGAIIKQENGFQLYDPDFIQEAIA